MGTGKALKCVQGLKIFFVAGAVLWAASLYAENNDLVMHRTQAGKPNNNGWYEAKSTEGSFTVFLPIPFNDFTTIWENESGHPAKAFVIGSKSLEGFKFSVVEIQKNNLSPEGAVQEFAAGYKAQQGPKIFSEKSFNYHGHPATQLQLTDRAMSAVTRFIALSGKNFLLTVEYPSQKNKEVAPLVEPFFDSLVIEE